MKKLVLKLLWNVFIALPLAAQAGNTWQVKASGGSGSRTSLQLSVPAGTPCEPEQVYRNASGSVKYHLVTITTERGTVKLPFECTAVTPAPTVTLAASPTTLVSGASTTLTWSAKDAASCTASGAWSGTRTAMGIQSSNALSATSTFTLSCTGAGGTAQASATVTVTPPLTAHLLTTTVTGSGTVASSPIGINCPGVCSAHFNPDATVTLTATSAAGAVFSGWSGACTGSGACVVSMAQARSVSATFAAATVASGAPNVMYTDLVSGPTSGGEGNLGAYLTIFGKNFGTASGLGTTTRVFIGNAEVASYRSLSASKVFAAQGIQQIVVQVGGLGGAAQGVALPVTVLVGGVVSNSDHRFMPNPGRMLYVDNVAGNDATAVPGDINKPYRYVQTPALYTGGAWAVVQPGDIIVMRGHGNASPWTDVGFEKYFMRYRNKSGKAATGVAGTGAIALLGYPGEDVYIRGTVAGGMSSGCISGINGQSFPGMGQWAVISNLRLDCEGYDGPISQQIFGHHWRVINNDLAASTAPRSGSNIPRMAGITGNGNNAVWYGNHIHDIQGSAQECHGIYIDGDGSYDIAYNHIHDIRDGNGFQVYVNGGNGSDYASNISLHHNLIHNVSKHGVNIADGASNNVKVWNNLVYNVQYAGIRFNTNSLHGAKIFNNTFYNTNLARGSQYGAITNDWNFPSDALDIQNNIFYVVSGTPYNSGSNGVPKGVGTIARNLWFNGSGSTAFDSAPILADPQFVAPGTDFHLRAGSPAIGVGLRPSAVTSLVTHDFDLKARGSLLDLGAFQY